MMAYSHLNWPPTLIYFSLTATHDDVTGVGSVCLLARPHVHALIASRYRLSPSHLRTATIIRTDGPVEWGRTRNRGVGVDALIPRPHHVGVHRGDQISELHGYFPM